MEIRHVFFHTFLARARSPDIYNRAQWRGASARFLTQDGVEPGGGLYKLYLKNTIQKTTYGTIHLV